VNSIRALGRAIDYEARRQIDVIESGGTIRQETRHWDDAEGRTHTLRAKEDADDYRYFPEPDLVPLDPGQEWIDRVRAELPPLPAERRAMLQALTGYDPQSEAVLVAVERGQHDYVKAIADAGGDPVRALIYVTQAFAEAGENPSVPTAAVTQRPSRPPRDSRRWTTPPSRRWWTRQSPPTLMRGRSTARARRRPPAPSSAVS
jgi:aspartyl-tRNA(Asn)/glutamyl-tRNA(Gln) amidotransferase subunit B